MDPAKLEELEQLNRAQLARRWETAFGRPAPRRCGATLLRLGVAWRMQADAAGLGHPSEKELTRALRSAVASGTQLHPGSRLVREWQGQTHHVTVVDGGFEYAGKSYRSLTAIARQITGTAWSGPLFFGLRK